MRGLIWIDDIRDFILRGIVLALVALLSFYGSFSIGVGGVVLSLLIFLIWIGEMVEIPLLTVRTKKPQFDSETAEILGKMMKVPLSDEIFTGNPRVYNSTISINLSTVFLLILSLVLFDSRLMIEHLTVIVITWVVVVIVSEIQSGIGIKTPIYVFLFPLVFSLLISPEHVAVISISSGVVGILFGQITILFSLRESEGSKVLSLGGFPSRDVYLALFVASLIAGWMG